MTSVSSNPYSYLGLLSPSASASSNVLNAAFPPTNNETVNALVTAYAQKSPKLPDNVLQILQSLSPDSLQADSITSLLNPKANTTSGTVDSLLTGNASDTGIQALLNQSATTLLSSAYATALQSAYTAQPQQTAEISPYQASLGQYQTASKAYNAALLQQAQATLAANSFGADGTLIA